MYYKNLTEDKKHTFKDMFVEYLFTDNSYFNNNLKLYIKKPHAFNLFFSYIFLEDNGVNKYQYINDFFNSYNEFILNNSYETTIRKTVDSLDIFGLGFTLKYTLNNFFTLNAINDECYNTFSTLFEQMYTSDFTKRIDNTTTVLEIYHNIFNKSLFDLKTEPEDNNMYQYSNNISNYLFKFAYEDAPSNMSSSKKTKKHSGGKRKKKKKTKNLKNFSKKI